MGEFNIRFDHDTQRLYIQLNGFFREADVSKIWVELERALEGVAPGFDVITDLRGFKPGSPAAARHMREAAMMIKKKGRRNGVRISGKLVTGMMQLNREVSGLFGEDTIHYASSVDEAEELLDNWPSTGT